jgi:lipopolysaccharide transport system permease protein
MQDDCRRAGRQTTQTGLSPTNEPCSIHSCDRELDQPLVLLAGIWNGFRKGRELAIALLTRNVRAQYRQSILGYTWIVIPPLVSAGAMVALAGSGMFQSGISNESYRLYAIVGMILWQAFFDGFSSPLRVVRNSISMLSCVRFPYEALIIAGIGETLWTFTVRLVVCLGLLLLLGWTPDWPLLFLPFGVFALVLLGWTFGMLLVPIGILFRDVEYSMGMIGMLWFLITPVAYAMPSDPIIPVRFNPVTPILEMNRALILGGAGDEITRFAAVMLLSCPLAITAVILFRVAIPHLIKRLPR